MQIISNTALISLNETLIVQLISFLIFLFIINRVMFRPLRSRMMDRDIHIEQLKTDINDAENRVSQITTQLKDKEASVRVEAFEVVEELKASGTEAAAGIFAEARDEFLFLRKKAEADVASQVSKAKEVLQKESETLAIDIMEKLLERRLSP